MGDYEPAFKLLESGSPYFMLLVFIWALLTKKIVLGWVYEDLKAANVELKKLNDESIQTIKKSTEALVEATKRIENSRAPRTRST